MILELVREHLGLLMLATLVVLLTAGFPVAFTLMGTAVAFAALGNALGFFDAHWLSALSLRLLGLMNDDLLQAVPVFIYLGVILQRTTLSTELLETMAGLFGKRAGGLGISSIALGVLLAPTTGVVGATVLTIGLLTLPSMLAAGYDRRFASGIVCCAGTLGTIIPPSIILLMLSAQMRLAARDVAAPGGGSISVNFLQIFVGVLLPVGALLAGYLAYVLGVAMLRPGAAPPLAPGQRRPLTPRRVIVSLVLPLGLIGLMLASILSGRLYTVEAAAIGAIAITIYTLLRRELTWERLGETAREVMRLSAVVFTLMIGAMTFTLVFRIMGGDAGVTKALAAVPGGLQGATLLVLALSLGLCLLLDALEILFVVVPLTMPTLLGLGGDPVWLSVMFAITIQSGFMMPPSGFAICFLRSVAPPQVQTREIYAGVVPLLAIQLTVLALLWTFPAIATWLPKVFYGPPP
ncbi:MAG: TRAP transporter large permease [Usitatibacter sp.]